MVFNSLTFIVFFTLLLLLHRLPFSWTTKKVNLLIASYIFYAAWNPPFILLLWASTIVDWFIARGIYAARDKSRAIRRSWLVISVAVNLGFIGFFKYGDFMLHNWQALMASFGIEYVPPAWHIVLPVGISFYTFVTMSYTLDVYLGRSKPIESPLNYALFVTFFPHLVAGPIVRPTAARAAVLRAEAGESRPDAVGPRPDDPGPLREGRHRRRRALERRGRGLRRAGTGRIRGCLARDARILRPDLLRLRRLLDHRDRRRAVPRLRAAGQLPHAVRGDRVLGFLAPLAHLAVHVAARLPVRAARRQSRHQGRTYVNLMLTMLLGGLWHGANWTFVAWGGLHGIYLAVERWIRDRTGISGEPVRWTNRVALALLTYMLVNITWVFFRAHTFGGAATILKGMFGFAAGAEPVLATIYMIKVGVLISGIVVTQWLMRERELEQVVSRTPWWVTGLACAAMLFAVIVTQGSGTAFIYFQF